MREVPTTPIFCRLPCNEIADSYIVGHKEALVSLDQSFPNFFCSLTHFPPALAGSREALLMPTISRLTGRFFAVLISLTVAVALLPAAALGEAPKSRSDQAPTLCQITDIVYRADGTPAQGTALISWPAFTTAAGQAVTPGSLTVTLDASGGFNASLAPNTGASPVGTYYRAIFKLNDGTTDSEYWVVPNTSSTTIGAIRSKLVPASQAAQFLTRDFADSTYVALASTQTITGVKSFANSPTVPTPQNPTDVANKSYVDATAGSGNLASPPPIGNVTPNSGTFTTLNNIPNAAAFPGGDACAKINAAIATLSAGGTVDARGFAGTTQTCNTTLTLPANVNLNLAGVHLTLNACPGINVTGPGSWLEGGSEATVGYSTGYGSTVIKSGSACPIVQGILTGTDGLTISNLEMDGNSVGTFGVFLPISGDNTFTNLNVHNFTANNVYATGGLNKLHDGFYQRAGCDGIVWGSDGTIDGKIESTYNGCDGLHVVGGGNQIAVNTLDLNTGRGAYLDGRIPGDWVASTAYHPGCYSEGVCGSITPHSGNPGNYNYKVIACSGDCKSGTVAPTWTQSGGAQIADNHVTWLATGNLYGSNGYGNHLTAGQFPYNGLEQIRIEGDPAAFAAQNSITAAFTNSAGNGSTSNSMGIHLVRATATDINGGNYFGSALNKKNDLGGLVVDNSFHTKITNFTCEFAHQNCVHVTNGSGYTSLNNVEVIDNGDSTTAGDGRYGILSDSGTLYTSEGSGTMVVDERSPAYSLGAKNYSAGAFPFGYQSNITGNSYPDNFGASGGFLYEQDTGHGHNPYIPFFDHLDLGGGVNGSAYAPLFQFNNAGLTFYSPLGIASGVSVSAANATFTPYQITWPTTAGASGQCLTSAGGGTTPMTWGPCSANLSSPPPIGNGTPNTINATALTFQNIPGVEFLVSRYASIQAAINAAYNSGAVLGKVVDDRMSPYTGPGFIVYDSVTLQLAATTYTINGTVTYNNGNNVVTAGIIALPGARLIGASTSTNHGTIITAANGLNADLIATSTVGTGIAGAAQWWHWGGFQDLRVMGNGAHQTAGNCFNIENMGETAFLRTIEVSGCYRDNILFTGASATASDIANITTNSAGRYGFNFNNLSGVAVVHGLSGDSNTTSLVRLNGGQSGTLTIVGFKTEEEISGQDPLITIDQTGQNGAQPSLYIVGGYTFGRSGVNDVIRYVNGTVGTTPYISVTNFYVQDYVNAVNDVVNGRSTAAVNMNKVPFYYGPTGGFLSGQAFTLDLNTFIQSPHSGNGILTEVFGTTSSNETLVAASGTSTDLSVGGIGFRMANRTTYGQSPELFAKMTYAFPGGIPNTQQWEFIPAKVGGDSSSRWIGDPNYRWDEVYAADVNTTTATVGTLNVTNCNGCGVGTRVVSGTMQGATGTLAGNGTDQAIYTATLPAGTFTTHGGVHCYAKWTHPTASGAITYKWTLGTTTWAYGSYTSSSLNVAADIEVLTITSLASQSVNLSPVIAGTAIGVGGSYGNAGSENLANADTVKLTFNAGASDQVKGATFYCQTVE